MKKTKDGILTTDRMMQWGMILTVAYIRRDRERVQQIVAGMDEVERRYLVRFLNWALAIVDG
jgi:hypothetical protein